MDMYSESVGTDIDLGNELIEGEEYGDTEESEIDGRTSEDLGESETFSEEEEEVHTEVVYVTNDSGYAGINAQELQVALSPITAILLITLVWDVIKSVRRKEKIK